MASNSDYFLKKTLGEDFFESLEKFELWKPGTRTTLDHEEMKTALQIVPRTIMSLLVRELSPMSIGQNKQILIPSQYGNSTDGPIPYGTLMVTKHERDVYSGEVISGGKKLAEFKYRSLPGVGLVVMSTFELYDTEQLVEEPKETAHDQDLIDKVQKIIDERLQLHSLISQVVDKKIQEKDAIQQLILAKLSESLEFEKKKKQIAEVSKINKEVTPQEDEYFRGMSNGLEVANSIANDKEPEFVDPKPKKGSPLKDFLSNRKKKMEKKEHMVYLAKNENVSCPDCGKNIFDGKVFSGCVCLGDDKDKKIFIKKSEDGIKVRFGRGWDKENIEMLLDVLRGKNGK